MTGPLVAIGGVMHPTAVNTWAHADVRHALAPDLLTTLCGHRLRDPDHPAAKPWWLVGAGASARDCSKCRRASSLPWDTDTATDTATGDSPEADLSTRISALVIAAPLMSAKAFAAAALPLLMQADDALDLRKGRCCVLGCERAGAHNLDATVTVDRIGLEDSTVDAFVCCEHLDMLSSGPPFVYLTVSGYVGVPA